MACPFGKVSVDVWMVDVEEVPGEVSAAGVRWVVVGDSSDVRSERSVVEEVP